MIEILICALPQDRMAAERIINALHREKVAGLYQTRFLTADPLDAGWGEEQRLAETAACVLFCWSHETQGEEARRFRSLAAKVLETHRALSIELAPDTLPPEMHGSSCYPLPQPRWLPPDLAGLLFGDLYLTQIVAAAVRKVSGQDPPPPQAFWDLVRVRVRLGMVGAVALLGAVSMFWGFYNDENLARLVDRDGAKAFHQAEQGKNCEAARRIVGAWAQEAQGLVARCHKIMRTRAITQDFRLTVYGETAAEIRSSAWARCRDMAINGQMALEAVALERIVPHGLSAVACRFRANDAHDVEIME